MFLENHAADLDAIDIDNRLVLVTGLPRSGTTIVSFVPCLFIVAFTQSFFFMATQIHNLLSCDKSMLAFDYSDYFDPTAVEEEKRTDVMNRLEFLKRAMPRLSRKHNLKPTKKEDDYFLMRHAFINPIFALSTRNCDEYRDWLFDKATDLTPFYEELRLFWKTIILKKGVNKDFKHLVVKSPFHASFHTSFSKVFPKCKYVVVARDPGKSLTSFCSVLHTINSYYEHSVDLKYLGRVGTDFRLMQQFVDAKDDIPKAQCCNVQFKWLMVDASVAIKSIHSHFGWRFENLEARRIYIRDNPAELFGKHVYDAKTYFIDLERLGEIWNPSVMNSLPSTPVSTPSMTKLVQPLTELAKILNGPEGVDGAESGGEGA